MSARDLLVGSRGRVRGKLLLAFAAAIAILSIFHRPTDTSVGPGRRIRATGFYPNSMTAGAGRRNPATPASWSKGDRDTHAPQRSLESLIKELMENSHEGRESYQQKGQAIYDRMVRNPEETQQLVSTLTQCQGNIWAMSTFASILMHLRLDSAVIASLIGLARSSADPTLQRFSLIALSGSKDETISWAALEILQTTPHSEVKVAALNLLRYERIKHSNAQESAVREVFRQMEDGSNPEPVRSAATLALVGPATPPELALRVIPAILRDSSTVVRQAGVDALSRRAVLSLMRQTHIAQEGRDRFDFLR